MNFARWNAELESRFAQYVADGMSAGEAANAIGCTRSAAIGKARRMKLVWDRSRGETDQRIIRKAKRARPKRRGLPAWHEATRAEAASVKPVEAPRAIPPAPNSKPVDLMGLTNNTCRWPLWENDEPRLFCGAPEADMGDGRPYCPYHAAAATTRPYTRQERFEFRKARG